MTIQHRDRFGRYITIADAEPEPEQDFIREAMQAAESARRRSPNPPPREKLRRLIEGDDQISTNPRKDN